MASAGDKSNYVKVPLWLLERRDIEASDKLIYAKLRDREGENGVSWPGQRCIGRDTGLGTGTVWRAVNRLVAAGLLEVVRAGSKGGKRTNRYIVIEPERPDTEHKRPDLERPGTEHKRPDLEREAPRIGAKPDQENQTKRTRPREPAAPAEPGTDLFGVETGGKPKRRRAGKGAAKDGEPDTLTRDVVAAWVETYTRARGKAPKLSGKDVGTLKRIAHEMAVGDLDDARAHFELAAGLNCRPRPFPFNKPGTLTPSTIEARWSELSDSLNSNEENDDRNGREKRTAADRRGAAAGIREHKRFRILNP